MDLLSLVEIGFPTKDRWDDVRTCLTHLAAFGLGDLHTLVFDDGSREPCPLDVAAICPGAELTRFAESEGWVARRNQMATEMKSKYFFGLDDDSFPESGSLESAVRFAESQSDLFALTFPVFNPRLNQWQVESLQPEPYQVRSFIGCGFLVNRQRFAELGGFDLEFSYFNEEREISVRAFQQGLKVIHYPHLLIHHTYSLTSRNWNRMDYYGARNNVLWNDWYVPKGHRFVKQARTALSRCALALKTRRFNHLTGQFAGVLDAAALQHKRRPLAPEQFKHLATLPYF